jgi:hypothetical protein
VLDLAFQPSFDLGQRYVNTSVEASSLGVAEATKDLNPAAVRELSGIYWIVPFNTRQTAWFHIWEKMEGTPL